MRAIYKTSQFLLKTFLLLTSFVLTSCFLNARMDNLDASSATRGKPGSLHRAIKLRVVSPINENIELTSVKTGETLVIDIQVQDENGNPLEKEIVKLFISGTGNSSNQIEMLTDKFGRHQETFSSTKAEIKTLSIYDTFSSYEGPAQIVIEHGLAQNLVFITQPVGDVAPNQVISQQPTIEIQDAYGNRVVSGPDSSANITLTLTTGSGALSGTTTLTAIQGLVQFSNIAVTAPGASDVISAEKEDKTSQNGTGVLSVTSSPFTISTTPTLSQPTDISIYAGNKDSNKSPTVNVSGVIGGDTVRLYSDNCITQIGSVVSSSTTAYVTPTVPLAEGSYTFYARRFNGSDSSACSTVSYNYTVVGLVNISQSTLINRILEGTGLQTITIELSSIQSMPVTVYYNLDGSTAHANQISLSNGSLTIPAGQLSASFSLNINAYVGVTGETKILVNIEGTDNDNIKVGKFQSGLIQIKDNEATYLQAAKITSGSYHVCAITSTSKLFCWGENFQGQIGQGDLYNKHRIPMAVDASLNYTLVAASGNMTCGITSTGVLKCWGNNNPNPAIVDTGVSYKSIAPGSDYYCGITSTDQLKCWGTNTYGQLGTGNTTTQATPVLVNGGTTYKMISAGRDSRTTCAITSSDILQCWGYNYYGQVGNGNNTDVLAPVGIDTGNTYKKISVGTYITCGLTTSNKLKCWGNGYLGNGTYSSNLSVPTVVDLNTDYADISVSAHACGLTSSSSIKCWGTNSGGQLGNGTTDESSTPSLINSSDSFAAVSVGSGFSCGLKSNGAVICWGQNSLGQFGYGNAYSNRVPTKVDFTQAISEVSIGDSIMCVIDSSQKLKCHSITYPYDTVYLGDGVPSSNKRTPVRVDPATNYSLISTNYNTSCGITASGALKCWGQNSNGQVGTGTIKLVSEPVTIDSGVSYLTVSNGRFHTCGITTAGVLKCWGQNTFGKLGDGTTVDKWLPTVIDTAISYKEVKTYLNHTCGITSADELKCWGQNSIGQLGDGSTDNRNIPTPINQGVFYKKVSTSGSHTCGITVGNKLKCWGNNTNGRLGDGSGLTQLSPVPVDASTDFKTVALGDAFGCAITSSDDLKCWGHNFYGQLGDGSSSNNSATPIVIDSGVKYSKISIYSADICAKVLTDGSIKCWGSNTKGAIGIKDIFGFYPTTYVTTFRD